MIEYVDVYLKKQSAEYARIILNVSDAVYGIRSLIYWAVTETDVFKTLSKISDKAFCKKNNAWMQVRN